jgi:hypothetical protein
MSISKDGMEIVCDGEGCQNRVKPPIGLRSTLSKASAGRQPLAGWLFVNGQGETRHYCPTCAAGMFEGSTEFQQSQGSPMKKSASGKLRVCP